MEKQRCKEDEESTALPDDLRGRHSWRSSSGDASDTLGTLSLDSVALQSSERDLPLVWKPMTRKATEKHEERWEIGYDDDKIECCIHAHISLYEYACGNCLFESEELNRQQVVAGISSLKARAEQQAPRKGAERGVFCSGGGFGGSSAGGASCGAGFGNPSRSEGGLCRLSTCGILWPK